MTAQDAISSATSLPGKYRLTIRDFRLLDDAGAFRDLGKTELIEGDVVAMSPEFRPHFYVKNELAYRLRRALEALATPLFVGTEGSVSVSDSSMPQPDIVLTSQASGEGPIPVASVALIVEVADSTLPTDLGVKAALYARAGVPEYWVADVAGKVLHQMWAPGVEGYAQRREVAFGERIAAETVAGLGVVLPL